MYLSWHDIFSAKVPKLALESLKSEATQLVSRL